MDTARLLKVPVGAIVLRYAGEPVASPNALNRAVAACSSDPTCINPELVWRSEGAEHSAALRPGAIGIETEALWWTPAGISTPK